MEFVEDIRWEKGMAVSKLVGGLSKAGFQGTQLGRAVEVMKAMKKDGAKIFLTFTSNMVTGGLRGFFAQVIQEGMAQVIVTTAGAVEEDIMKALGEKFVITSFDADDVELHEKGHNRVGNLIITNETYARFENKFMNILNEIKPEKTTVSELLKQVGEKLNDEKSFLFQAAKHNVPVFCPGITDGSIGFHLYLYKQRHKEFNVDVIDDFKNILFTMSPDDKKGIISLGGSISKHHAILAALISGGMDYAVYFTTSSGHSGSMSGATTNEAKSWGKIKDVSEAVTVYGDATILFPLAMIAVLEDLHG